MKRMVMVIGAVLLLALTYTAHAGPERLCDPVPDTLTARIRQDTWQDTVRDCIALTAPDGTMHVFIITGDGWGLYGYQQVDGGWVSVMSGTAMEDTTDVYFRRHGEDVLRPDGQPWPDSCGFDVYSASTGCVLSYRYGGEYFALTAWRNPAAFAGGAMLIGDTLSYYADGQAEPLASFALDEELRSWFVFAEDLPYTPEQAQALNAISQQDVADLYPGYTLSSYESYNGGSSASAAYRKVENSVLYVRRVTLEAGKGAVREQDCMPVPLSSELVARLATEPADTLLDVSGSGTLFLTESGLDTKRIPVKDKVLDSDLQADTLVLLVEDRSGYRRLTLVSMQGSAYRIDSTLPLPEDASLDIFHAGDGGILLAWSNWQAGYRRRSDGKWLLTWAMYGDEERTLMESVAFCGTREEWSAGSTAGMRFGTPAGVDLMQAEMTAWPVTGLPLDRTDWAVVNNPNPEDRLHLRIKPDKKATSLGKFYNGTPVHILEERGSWCRVEIGTDGHLQGWMMKKYLATGEDMDGVQCVFPQAVRIEEVEGMPLYLTAAGEGLTYLTGEWWIVGVVENDLYVILTDLGEAGYAPQSWFTDGNG
ncbi:MAG: SH3 domain-containing protein [Aristaeellaceae bacterium]